MGRQWGRHPAHPAGGLAPGAGVSEPGREPVELYAIHDREELKEYCEITGRLGVKMEIEAFHYGGVWNAMRMREKGLLKDDPIWVTFFLGWKGGCWTPPTVEAMSYMAHHCPPGFIWNTSVMDPVEQWKVLSTAINLGGHIRIGMEDNPFLSPGAYARNNAELVDKMAAAYILQGAIDALAGGQIGV